MAARININGIQYNNVEPSGKITGTILSHSPYVNLDGQRIDNYYSGEIKEPIRFINAIDISWNGAVLEKNGVTLNKTSDLLKQLEIIYEKFDNYASKDSLDEILGKSNDAYELAQTAYELAQNNNQVQSDWSENDQNSPAFILNKPIIPTSIYDLSNYDDFATQTWVNNRLRRYNSAYDIYVEQQQESGNVPLEQSEWIESLHGKDGSNGLSAWELAVKNGLTNLSEAEWVKSLQAKDGWSAYEIAVNNGYTDTESEWLKSLKGDPGEKGKSNYDIYVEVQTALNKEVLSEKDWLESLKGSKGDKGDKGDPGKDGNSVQILASFDTIEELREEVDGKYYALGSAYLVNGYLYVYNDSGTTFEEQWRNVGEIKGPKGDKGDQGNNGKSNYEIYKDLAELNGETPLSEADWLASLKGERGKSNYDIYVELAELNGETPLSETDWLESLKTTTVYTGGDGISISSDNVISLNRENMWITIN